MGFGQSTFGATGFAQRLAHSGAQAFVPPDTILRQQALKAAYQLLFAWQGNLTQLRNAAGVQIPAVIAQGSQDAGFPASNVISGSNVHYNPAVDLDNNWWQAASGPTQFLTIDLGSSQPFSEVQVYLHPFRPTCTLYTIQGSNDNATWSTLYSGGAAGAGSLTKNVIALGSPVTFRYVRFIPLNGGSDGKVRVVAIELYLWTDETGRVDDLAGQPNITLETKSDFEQSGLATASDLQAVLENEDGRYSPFNTASLIYGTAQVDGRGSGVRSGVPARLFASATASVNGSLSSFTKKVFEGFILNDDSASGVQGVILDVINKQATVVCKSLYTLLDKVINVPVYNNMFYSQVVADICWRCGIAQQNIATSALQQMLPYAAFGQASGISMIKQLENALPYMRIFETYSPGAVLNFVNKGRSRADLGPFLFQNSAPGNFISTGPYSFLSNLGLNICGLWDMRTPYNSVVPVSFTPVNVFFKMEFNGLFYGLDVSNNTMWQLNPFAAAPAWVNLGSIGALPSGTWANVAPFKLGKYLFMVAQTSSGNKAYGYVWDTTQAIGTTRALGLIASPGALGAVNVFVDGTYAVFVLSETGFPTTMTDLYVWQHNGTPLTTAFTTFHNILSPAATPTANGAGSISNFNMGLLDLSHNFWYYDTAANLQSLSIPSIVAGSPVTTNAGNVKALIGALDNNVMYGLQGNYIYTFNIISGTSPIISVWDTTKPFSKYTVISSNATQANGVLLGFDSFGMVWAKTGNNTFTGFLVQGTAQWPTAGQYGFTITDGFTENINMSDGNPSVNHIQVFSAAQSAAASTNVFTQSQNLTVLAGVVNSFSFQTTLCTGFRTPGGSANILGVSAFGSQRYINLNVTPISQAITAGGTTTTVTVASTAGLAVGMLVQLTGGTGEIQQVTGLTPTTITLGAVNGTTHTAATWGHLLIDDPTLTQLATTNSFPATFFCYGDIAYLSIDATAASTTFTLSGMTITGQPVTSPTSSSLVADVKDITSIRLYGQEFRATINTPYFNDYTMWFDILNAGKYAVLFLQELNLPWYPAAQCEDVFSLTEPTYGLNGTLFEAVDVKHTGFTTTVSGKMVNPIFNI